MRFKIILLSLLLASCSSVPMPSAYKMDIRQGNYVTAEMRDKIKLGMSRAQVRYVMGTPMVSDVFHANRWDYVYRLEHGRELVEQQRLTLYFEGENLVRIDDSGLHVKPAPVAPESR
jgi:outer membrane protein assembly factor BamE